MPNQRSRSTYTPWRPACLAFRPTTLDVFWNLRASKEVHIPSPEQLDHMVANSIFITYKAIDKALEETK